MGQREPPPSFARIVAAVAPAVVTIVAVVEPEPGSGYPDPGDELAGEDGTLGSGVIIDPTMRPSAPWGTSPDSPIACVPATTSRSWSSAGPWGPTWR
jgi:hypothetical protein